MLIEEIQGKNKMKYKLFVDMDGVLADFIRGVERAFQVVHGDQVQYSEERYEQDKKFQSMVWKTIQAYQQMGHEFWYDLELMDDALTLWNYVKPYTPEILSATGQERFESGNQKIKWIAQKIGNVKVNLTQKASEKAQHAQPNYILIDDKLKAINPWIDAGGIGILHTSANSTIQQLKKLGL